MKTKKPKKIKKTKKTYGGLNYYITFLDQHFLTPTLDHIFHKTSLTGQFFGTGTECNITMLGDIHNMITHNGVDMITAFNGFTATYQTYKALLPSLDVFIESTENNSRNVYPNAVLHPANQQILNVAIYLNRCHRVGACPFNLHWIDTNAVPLDRTGYLSTCVGTPTTAATTLPRWIYELSIMHITSNDIQHALWKNNLGIVSKIRIKPTYGGIVFTDIHDCMKILTENCIIKREIAKATRVNPNFTYGYAKALLRELIIRPNYAKNIELPALICRQVLDIYTVARIINKRMSHVLIYVGASHSTFVSQILRTMGLRTVYHEDEMGTAAMPMYSNGPYDDLITYNNIPYTSNLPRLTAEPEHDDPLPEYPAYPLIAYYPVAPLSYVPVYIPPPLLPPQASVSLSQ